MKGVLFPRNSRAVCGLYRCELCWQVVRKALAIKTGLTL